MRNSIDFGSQVFRIEIVNGLFDSSVKMQGLIDPKQCLIKIEEDLDPQAQVLTLWHEIIHQLLNRVGHDNDEFINPKLEEALVENISEGIVLLLRLNPWLGDVE